MRNPTVLFLLGTNEVMNENKIGKLRGLWKVNYQQLLWILCVAFIFIKHIPICNVQ
jgi:putative copper export protein